MAIKIFSCNEYDKLVTLGWDYRVDCDTPIAEVVSDYIIKNSAIEKASVIAIRESRDTVGDSIYCLDFSCNFKLKKIVVVTFD